MEVALELLPEVPRPMLLLEVPGSAAARPRPPARYLCSRRAHPSARRDPGWGSPTGLRACDVSPEGAASGALGRALVLYCVFGVFLLAGRKLTVFFVFLNPIFVVLPPRVGTLCADSTV